MYNWKTKRVIFLVLLSLIMSTLLFVGSAAADDSAPLYLSFEKADPDQNYIWNGAVSGDVSGTLETRLLSARPTGQILQVEFDWIVDAGPQSFTARLSGILDTQSGAVTMNGTIIEGYLKGTQVHEEGQMVDAANSGFVGTIRIMPATTG
jgi:hypothetical protein